MTLHSATLVCLSIDGVSVVLGFLFHFALPPWTSAPVAVVYAVDMACLARRRALLPLRAAFVDLLLWTAMLVLWLCRCGVTDTSSLRLLYVSLVALRLVVKPRMAQLEADAKSASSSPPSASHGLPRHWHKMDDKAAPPHRPSSLYATSHVVTSTFRHWATQTTDLVWSLVAMTILASLTPLHAFCLQLLLDHAFRDPASSSTALRGGAGGLLALAVPFAGTNVAIGYIQARLLARATATLQQRLLAAALGSSRGGRDHGDVNNVFASDVARVNALWQAVFWNLLNPVVTMVVGFGYLMACDVVVAWLALCVAVVVVASGPQGRAATHSKAFGAANARLTATFQNALAATDDIRVFGMQSVVVAKFGVQAHALADVQCAKDLWATLVQVHVDVVMHAFVALVTAGLATQVVAGTRTPGDFVAFTAVLGRIASPVAVLGGFMRVAIGNASSLERVDALLSCETPVASDDDDGGGAAPLTNCLTLDRVHFAAADDAPIVVDVSMRCPRGSLTCIVGPSGSGKSSLLRCLMQMERVTGGRIWWDGTLLAPAHMAHVGVVFQDGHLLEGSVLDNIACDHDRATAADCVHAAALAQCHFVDALPDGMRTDVASVLWSGGQLQRLCLARALARRPSVLLLDEATSALDAETEAAIVASLASLGMTIVSVTHRLATTLLADHIVVLKEGRVVEEGTHCALMRRRGVFYEMARAHDGAPPGGSMLETSWMDGSTYAVM
ncbi:Aste57867_24274 [Aphanomyces stellatus]|uniref:Aste57867_24274 protein n=1 Tax=Aphanomyces stellatus TaxID=120398 RepID=A0A485LPY6_9STRA|nr:hypothetical protein As57867_024199 [Aphanomyces stellatus]VFU00914.1 Aste57867_24274 [Aphanomyces stellatus]